MMDRRDFMKMVPATAAGVAGIGLAGDVVASESGAPSRGHGLGSKEGNAAADFRLIGERNRLVSLEGSEDTFSLHEFVVECPYPVGSKAWVAVADHLLGERVLDYAIAPLEPERPEGAESESHKRVRNLKSRRVIFPRFSTEAPILDDADLVARARGMYEAVWEFGFDTARGPDHKWMVVSVEYRCPDGVEHMLCGLPTTWDPRLVLGVMVRGQIG